MIERTGSFPFLAIAAERGVPYAEVIRQAEAWWQAFETGNGMPPGANRLSGGSMEANCTIDNDVVDAVVRELERRRRDATARHRARHTGDAP